MALRNLGRHGRRTVLSLLVIAAGTAALVLTLGYIRHSFDGLRDALVFGGLGHLAVMPKGMDEASSAAQAPMIDDWAPLAESVERLPGVAASAPALRFSGLLSADDRTAAFIADALDPVRQRALGFEPRILEGRWLSDAAPAEAADEVVLGAALARTLGVHVADTVTLMGLTGDGMVNALDVNVVGTTTTGVTELDARLVRVHVVTGQRLTQSSAVSSLTIVLNDASNELVTRDAVVDLLRGREPELVVLGWRERAPFFGQVRSLYRGMFAFLGTIIAVVSCLAITNSMLMSVLERTRELGVLRAIGTSRIQMTFLLVAEAAWLGLFGVLLGAGGAMGTAAILQRVGIELPPPPGASSPILLELTIRPIDVLGVAAGMLTVVLLASAMPLGRVLRLSIVGALADR